MCQRHVKLGTSVSDFKARMESNVERDLELNVEHHVEYDVDRDLEVPKEMVGTSETESDRTKMEHQKDNETEHAEEKCFTIPVRCLSH